MAEDMADLLEATGMNKTELLLSFFAFLEKERKRKELLSKGPTDLQNSLLLLLLCMCIIVVLFTTIFYWKTKFGVGSYLW